MVARATIRPMPLDVDEIPSRRFGKYFIREKIGEGGMAEIFRADVTDDGVMGTVAIKVLKPDQPPRVADLFFAEADLMGLLDHPNLVRRLEVGSLDGERLFISMEDLYGGDLSALVRFLADQSPAEKLPHGAVLHICLEVLHALAYFHTAQSGTGSTLGLVHGDLNPSNILFSAYGEVKLADFGVASIPGVGAGLEEGQAAGKLHFLSPEQVSGQPLTAVSDLFALGSTLFQLLFGELPFNGNTEDEVLTRIQSGKFKMPASADADLQRIFKKVFAVRPKDRYQTAGQLAGDLLTYQLDRRIQFFRPQMQELIDRAIGVVI